MPRRTEMATKTSMRPIDYANLQRSVPFQERPTCSIAEACNAIGFGRTKLYELIDDGAVDTVKIGRRRLVRVRSLLQLLDTNNQQSAS